VSVAYFIVLDKPKPGFETHVNGKAVAHALEGLDVLCENTGLTKLDGFLGHSLDELADLMGDDMELPDEEETESKWFAPQEGIEFMDALIAAVRKNSDSISYAVDVVKDLEEYKDVLVKAAAIGAKWHLSLDI